MKKLLTIEEHNNRILGITTFLTGVACPNCSKELQFKTPGVVMLSSPPQADVICFDCNYSTMIYV